MNTKLHKEGNRFFRIILFLFFTGIALLLSSCYPGETLTPADTDVIATFYNPDADFSTKMTFAMPDSVLYIDKDGNPVDNDGVYDQQILNRIKTNMTAMGYTEEQDPANADVFVFTFVTTQTWVAGGCYTWWYDWWWGYPGWCYPTYYTYSVGTIVVAMVDPNAQGQTNAMWVAAINGILEDTGTGIATRINNNIDQAFKQSPYLGAGK